MPAIAWLVVAVVAGAAAYLVGWPSWRSYRARETRDPTLSDTGLGVGPRLKPGTARTREGMTATSGGASRLQRRWPRSRIAALIGFFVAG